MLGRKTKYTKPDKSVINYTYDNMGNMLSEGSNKFTYDARGKVLTANNPNTKTKYAYDIFCTVLKKAKWVMLPYA